MNTILTNYPNAWDYCNPIESQCLRLVFVRTTFCQLSVRPISFVSRLEVHEQEDGCHSLVFVIMFFRGRNSASIHYPKTNHQTKTRWVEVKLLLCVHSRQHISHIIIVRNIERSFDHCYRRHARLLTLLAILLLLYLHLHFTSTCTHVAQLWAPSCHAGGREFNSCRTDTQGL